MSEREREIDKRENRESETERGERWIGERLTERRRE